MNQAVFSLSAFGDEISPDLAVQCNTLRELKVKGLDLRGAWGKNVLKMDDTDIKNVKSVCGAYGINVRCLGSPVGKSPLKEPIQNELANLTRLIEIANQLDTQFIRIFSFYPPDASTNEHYDQYVPEAAEKLSQLATLAEEADKMLVLENEKHIVGDTPERCLSILKLTNSPAMRFAWDPANFIQVGVAQPVTRGWDMLQSYIGYVHIKDAMLVDGKVKPAGEGDGQVRELLANLKAIGYQGVLSLEPHLAIAGHSSGFSGEEGMGVAVRALRKLMAELGLEEI